MRWFMRLTRSHHRLADHVLSGEWHLVIHCVECMVCFVRHRFSHSHCLLQCHLCGFMWYARFDNGLADHVLSREWHLVIHCVECMVRDVWHCFPHSHSIMQRDLCGFMWCSGSHHRLADHVLSREWHLVLHCVECMVCFVRHCFPHSYCLLQCHLCGFMRLSGSHHRLADHVLSRERSLELHCVECMVCLLRHRFPHSHSIMQCHLCWFVRLSGSHHRQPDDLLPRQRTVGVWRMERMECDLQYSDSHEVC